MKPVDDEIFKQPGDDYFTPYMKKHNPTHIEKFDERSINPKHKRLKMQQNDAY